MFEKRPIVVCSYLCKGYNRYYGDYSSRPGVVFETDAKPVYACPVDVFELLRNGIWLPGYERFIFPSIEKMLEKYPTSNDFKLDFQEYFRNLDPTIIHPQKNLQDAQSHHEIDYCLKSDWVPSCNEIAFDKPLKIKNIRVFNSKKELKEMLEK